MTRPAIKIDHKDAIEKVGLNKDARMLIAGEMCAAADGGTMPVTDPSTGGSLGTIPVARAADIDRAVGAARAAFEGAYGKMAPYKRAKAMIKLAELCETHAKDLATIESLDIGVPRTFTSKFSTKALSKNLEYYASWTDKQYGEVIPGASGMLDYATREPYGVVASLISWNTPLLFVGSKLGPALATGNVVILKPSERGSLAALRVAELVAEAGFPPGTVQVISGDGETGRLLCEHEGIDLISFTGGGSVANHVLAGAAKRLTPTMMELGGKSANIIFGDANLDKATMMSSFGIFGLSGQACAAGSRWIVHRSVYDKMIERVSASAFNMIIGDPLSPMTLIGPLVSKDHRDRVKGYIDRAQSTCRLVRAIDPPPGVETGSFLGPHIFADVPKTSELWKEEVFGPVLAITPFDSDDEAIALANDSQYGLAAALWTSDVTRAHKVAGQLRAGTVWVNAYGTLPTTAPFGGFKKSGWGREGGRDPLFGYTQVKNVLVNLE
ncbi:MAG: aldehyde dehydrogenase [Kofleriaceae bacterium]